MQDDAFAAHMHYRIEVHSVEQSPADGGYVFISVTFFSAPNDQRAPKATQYTRIEKRHPFRQYWSRALPRMTIRSIRTCIKTKEMTLASMKPTLARGSEQWPLMVQRTYTTNIDFNSSLAIFKTDPNQIQRYNLATRQTRWTAYTIRFIATLGFSARANSRQVFTSTSRYIHEGKLTDTC